MQENITVNNKKMLVIKNLVKFFFTLYCTYLVGVWSKRQFFMYSLKM